MNKLGIIGTGNIATVILDNIKTFNIGKIYVYDINPDVQKKFVNKFRYYPIFSCGSILEVVTRADIILETASITAVEKIFELIKKRQKYKKKKFIFLSVGGVLKHFNIYQQLIDQGYNIYIPSGAIAGCDALSAISYSKIKSINLKTIKPVNSLLDAPYFKVHRKILKKMLTSQRTVVFNGDVYTAVENFPQNINIAATLAVVSGCPQKVKVCIVADKNLKQNIHEINVISSAGRLYIRTENLPLPNNPKTSYLAALSVLHLLKQLLR